VIREAIAQLADGRPLDGDTAYRAFQAIMAGECSDAQVGAFITALRIRGETAEIVAGCARAMREKVTPVETPDREAIDVVGTGGDGAQTFNISTITAFIVAGCGVTVAKHGNRGVSSRCGAADVLEALGVNLAVHAAEMSACLREVGIAFLFAPSLHPAMKHAIGPRREIGIRTIFNILGPLTNPAGVRRGLMGVYSRDLAPLMADAMRRLDGKHWFFAHGSDGLDEITLTGPTHMSELKDGEIRTFTLDPAEYGLTYCRPVDLLGGDPQENAAGARKILEGTTTGPRRDIVCLNAAAALVAAGRAADLAAGLTLARTSLDEGRALARLESLIAHTR